MKKIKTAYSWCIKKISLIFKKHIIIFNGSDKCLPIITFRKDMPQHEIDGINFIATHYPERFKEKESCFSTKKLTNNKYKNQKL